MLVKYFFSKKIDENLNEGLVNEVLFINLEKISINNINRWSFDSVKNLCVLIKKNTKIYELNISFQKWNKNIFFLFKEFFKYEIIFEEINIKKNSYDIKDLIEIYNNSKNGIAQEEESKIIFFLLNLITRNRNYLIKDNGVLTTLNDGFLSSSYLLKKLIIDYIYETRG